MVKDSIRIFERARHIRTDSDHVFGGRFVVEEGIELDNAVHIRKRYMQCFRDLGGGFLRNPAIQFLSRVQGW
jgi:hypothetical protein